MRGLLLACALAAGVQLLFVGKPLHIDDYLFLRIARNVERFPLAPFVGVDLFTGALRELAIHNNPPLVPAVLALAAAWRGEDVAWLHLCMLPFTLLAVVGFWGMARRFCEEPGWPTLCWATGLPLLLSGQHLMSDVPALALALGSLALLVDGRPLFWLPSAALLGLAMMAKYSMAFFLPYSLWLAWRLRMERPRLALFALLALLPSALWALHNLIAQGELHVLASGRQGADSPLGLDWTAWWWVRQKAIYSLAALGQTGAPILLSLSVLLRERPRWLAPLCLGVAALLSSQLPDYGPGELVQFGAWAWLGCFLLLAPLFGGARPELKWWFYPLAAATVWLFPFGSVRFLLPCFPPLLLSLCRRAEELGVSRLEKHSAWICGLLLGLAVCRADDAYARLYGPLAEQAAGLARQRGVPIWFAAEGALRPLLEERGAHYLTSRVKRLPAGSLVAIAANCHHYGLSPELSTVLYEDRAIDATIDWPLRLESSEAHAGFYAHPNGYLPVSVSTVPAESLHLFRVDAPNPFALYFLEHREEVAVRGSIVENVHQFKRGFWPSFLAHPPSLARFGIDPSPGSSVRFGFGLREEVCGPSYGDGVTFRVRVRPAGSADGDGQLLFERTIDPKHRPEERKIHWSMVNLGAWANQKLWVEFENDCGPVQDCRYDWAFWTMPELLDTKRGE